MSRDFRNESIVLEELTEGTETSHYLREKKAIAIPPVAASEEGTVQTGGMSSLPVLYHQGCRAGQDATAVASGSKKPIF